MVYGENSLKQSLFREVAINIENISLVFVSTK